MSKKSKIETLKNHITKISSIDFVNLNKEKLEDIVGLYIRLSNFLDESVKIRDNLIALIVSEMKKASCVSVFVDGKECSLEPGKMVAQQGLEEEWQSSGFDLRELGNYTWKPKWSLVRKIIKSGGIKAEIIDKYLQRTIDVLKIKDN